MNLLSMLEESSRWAARAAHYLGQAKLCKPDSRAEMIWQDRYLTAARQVTMLNRRAKREASRLLVEVTS